MSRPLEGLLILEFAQYMAGPWAGLRLADMGATVIKVERPIKGEAGRSLATKNMGVDGDSLVAHTVNRGKGSFAANLKDAERIIRDTILSDDRAHSDPEPFIQVTNLGDSSVDFLVRIWCNAGDYFAFKADMTRQVKEALDAGGVDIPFPTRTIYQAD